MILKRVLIGALALASCAISVQAAQKGASNGKRYAKAVKQEESVSKFNDFSEHEESYPSDALYSSMWLNDRVNPYQAILPDSFKIVLSDYVAPTENAVTSEYGPRWGRFHAGVDIAVRTGDSIRVAFDGQVRIGRKFDKGGYGWYIVVRHDNGLETLYGHLKRSLVTNDQRVKAGDVIGLGGSTGRSTGPHLHFETRFLGVPMNPRNIIDFDANVIYSDEYIVDKKKSFREYNKFHGLYREPRKRKSKNGAVAQVEVVDSASSNAEDKAMANAKRTIRYTVKQGDNLYRIAREYNTSVARICELNGINRDGILSLGKKLLIETK